MASALMLGIGCFVQAFYVAWQRFASEDRFEGTFEPLSRALDQFRQSKGTLPTNLTQLVPAYLPRIPTVQTSDLVEYRVMPDGTNWQLTVHSRSMGKPRVFIQRSSRQFTPEEQRKSVTSFHDWVVFRCLESEDGRSNIEDREDKRMGTNE
ncbi:MAG: hypothetical protein C5B50_28940 [Verrucomicrobia bacterium]|nr:MAG: hypothetical protein C5B50_28940 [Verrucomicrobiota bacterium]